MAGFTINTNIMSIDAQRNLRATQVPQAKSMQRLSSGLRINSAADDAAGLAIATRMDAQTRGLTVASRNAADGLSIAQTAESGMDEMTNDLQRIRELAVQAMSGQYGVTDISNMQMEVDALIEQIGSISQQTKFNDNKLLSGTFTSRIFTSYSASDTSISLALTSMNTDAMGGSTFNAQGKFGPVMYLKDVHTAAGTTLTASVANALFVPNETPAPYAYSDTSKAAITYTGLASLQVGDPTSLTGYKSQASNTIAIVDGALNIVIASKSSMGAKSNEFNAVITSIDAVNEATLSSRSRIMDADFATETANMTKYNILQQAGISVLSQANSLPQNVLKLLQ
ncbi:MAG: flagellin FliC [Nitrospirae bacterium]|nr:flagellin FliC [Nitrospirota bacterium]